MVTPANVASTTGAITGSRRHFPGLVRSVHASSAGGLAPGDLLVPPSSTGHVLLVAREHGGFVFSAGYTALRPNPGVDGLWLWAVLNSASGQKARGASSSGLSGPRASLGSVLEVQVPLPGADWSTKRPVVEARHAAAAAIALKSEAGQSWWRMARLPPGRSWHVYLTTQTPEVLEEGVPLGDLAHEFIPGRRVEVTLEEPRPGWVPYLSSRDLRTSGKPSAWTKDQGFVAGPGDLAVAEVGHRGPAVRINESLVHGNGITIVRIPEPEVAARVLAYLNSQAGQAARAVLATGSTIPHFGVRALRSMRIPSAVLEADTAEALVDPPVEHLAAALEQELWS